MADDEDLGLDGGEQEFDPMAVRKAEKKGAPTSDEEDRPDLETVGAAELRSFIERIERLLEQKAEIAQDVKDVYGELKGRGYDVKAVRTIIARRKRDANEVAEEESVLDTYLMALGMI